MSSFVNHIGAFFARYAPVEGFGAFMQTGVVTLNDEKIIKVEIPEDRRVIIFHFDPGDDLGRSLELDRDDFINARRDPVDGAFWIARQGYHSMRLVFAMNVTTESMRELTGQLYDYD